MTQVMTPSSEPKTTTDGQIGKLYELFSARLRKSSLPSDLVQQVLATEGDAVADEMVAAVRTRVEALSNMIILHWKANRTQSPQEVLKATGRKRYVDDAVVSAMPRGEGEEGETVFFKLDLSKRGGWINDDDLEKEFESHGLLPEYPDNLADVNKADPAFADEHPNCTHWKDKNGKWCYAAFDRWDGERLVSVGRDDLGWDDCWWFAGRRK